MPDPLRTTTGQNQRTLKPEGPLNPHTRGGHIVYALGAPVCLSNAGNRKPVNLLARVEAGLTRVLGGDPAFAGRITKNPECTTAHLPLWGRPKLSTT